MATKQLDVDCWTAGLDRLVSVFEDPNNVPVVSFSGGKDSTITLNLTILAMEIAERDEELIDVVWLDNEVVYPSTRQLLDYYMGDPILNVMPLVSTLPSLNIYNRAHPYYDPYDFKHVDNWVYRPVEGMWFIGTEMSEMIRPGVIGQCDDSEDEEELFAHHKGKNLISIQGIRASESMTRRAASHQTTNGLFKQKSNKHGTWNVMYPIYDWSDNDVWTAFSRNPDWKYNELYDHMFQQGLNKRDLRIGHPGVNHSSTQTVDVARKVWPMWWERVKARLPGIAAIAEPGYVCPNDMVPAEGRTYRDMVDEVITSAETPKWIARVARELRENAIRRHRQHSTESLPETSPCKLCRHDYGSWRAIFRAAYTGDPNHTVGKKMGVSQVTWEELDEYTPKPTASVKMPESEMDTPAMDEIERVMHKLAKPEFDQAWVRA